MARWEYLSFSIHSWDPSGKDKRGLKQGECILTIHVRQSDRQALAERLNAEIAEPKFKIDKSGQIESEKISVLAAPVYDVRNVLGDLGWELVMGDWIDATFKRQVGAQ